MSLPCCSLCENPSVPFLSSSSSGESAVKVYCLVLSFFDESVFVKTQVPPPPSPFIYLSSSSSGESTVLPHRLIFIFLLVWYVGLPALSVKLHRLVLSFLWRVGPGALSVKN